MWLVDTAVIFIDIFDIMADKYIPLEDLEIYKLSRELSKIGWKIYNGLNWQMRKINGDQFIESTDSVGANIAEGYKRFHYLEKIKFCYIARASLAECNEHWLELLKERNQVNVDYYKQFKVNSDKLSLKLYNFISSIYKSKRSVN